MNERTTLDWGRTRLLLFQNEGYASRWTTWRELVRTDLKNVFLDFREH